MKKTIFKPGVMLVLLIGVLMLTMGNSPIDGKTVEMIVPFGPGGSFDTTTRLVAPYLEKALEEITGTNQTVIVINKPGASGKISYDLVYKSKADKPRFVMMSASAIPQQVGMKTIYDVTKFNYIGRASVDYRAIYGRKAIPINTFAEFVKRSQTKAILMGTSGFGASEHQNSLMMADILKRKANTELNLSFVHYTGAGEITAALMKGDIEYSINSIPDTLKSVKGGYGKVLVQIAPKRTALLPGVPTLIEAGVSKNVATEIEHVLMQKRSFVASPNMDKALADLLRKGINQAFRNPELLSRAKAVQISIDYADPETDHQHSIDTLQSLKAFQPLLKKMYE